MPLADSRSAEPRHGLAFATLPRRGLRTASDRALPRAPPMPRTPCWPRPGAGRSRPDGPWPEGRIRAADRRGCPAPSRISRAALFGVESEVARSRRGTTELRRCTSSQAAVRPAQGDEPDQGRRGRGFDGPGLRRDLRSPDRHAVWRSGRRACLRRPAVTAWQRDESATGNDLDLAARLCGVGRARARGSRRASGGVLFRAPRKARLHEAGVARRSSTGTASTPGKLAGDHLRRREASR